MALPLRGTGFIVPLAGSGLLILVSFREFLKLIFSSLSPCLSSPTGWECFNLGGVLHNNTKSKVLSEIFANRKEKHTEKIIQYHQIAFIPEIQEWFNI